MARPKDTIREAQVRQKILRAFSTLLVEKSWENISIREICREADISVGAFYHYYHSKDQLMFSKVDVMDQYFDTTVREQALTCTFADSIRLYVDTYLLFCKKKGPKYTSQVLRFHLFNTDRESERKRGVYTALYDIIQRAKNLGDISQSMDTHQMISELTGAIRGMIFQWCIEPERFDLDGAGKRMTEYYICGWLSQL